MGILPSLPPDFEKKLEEETKRINEQFRHFRGSATALSVTMIGVSAAAIFSLKDSPQLTLVSKFWITILFSAVIVLSFVVQYLYYLGNLFFAYMLQYIGIINLGASFDQVAAEGFHRSERKFSRLQRRSFAALAWMVNLTALLFIVSVIYYAYQLLSMLLPVPIPNV